jgi:carboxymethylenebutenolidase
MSEKKSQQPEQNSPDYYLAKPKSGKGRRVLVLHASWGLNQFIKGFCDRLAKEGFVALAPDLFHGAVASTIEQALGLSHKFEADLDAAGKEIKKAAEHLCTLDGTRKPGIGIVAFSMGGYWALWLASQAFQPPLGESNPVDAAVVFYATRDGDYTHSHAAFQFHFAETDAYEPAANVKKTEESLSAAGKPAEYYTYPGTTHWFFESDRPDAFHAASAELAWKRTVDLLKAHLKET